MSKPTKEQEAKIPEYIEKYTKIGLSTTPCNRQAAEKAVTDSYIYQKLPPPRFEWYDSPKQGARRAAELAEGTTDVTIEQIKDQASKASYGSFESYWVAFYDFITTEMPATKEPLVDIVKAIVADCGVYWTFEDVVVMTEKPIRISVKDDNLHNPDGLALEYKDGSGTFALNGERYSSLLEMTIKQADEN
jgi:hypothetical protein